tara:strand:- start:32 stop:1102 length:1071 start_codon:yes stop_codon:yes gene_type:complete
MTKNENLKLTFRGGGWVLVLLLVVVLSIIAWAVAPAFLRLSHKAPGDGQTVSSYLFEMDSIAVPEKTLVPAMRNRDMSPVLSQPDILSPNELANYNKSRRDKYIVSKDLVVGVEIGGETRAYPLHVLNVHEIVNDTLGGTPISVYWNWPSGNIEVFERMIDEKEVNFKISGLSGNGTMLLYPEKPTVGGEQLFSPILGSSITGPNIPLRHIPHEVVHFSNWIAKHPETTAISPIKYYKKRYRKGDPRVYFLNDTIYFPAEPMPADTLHPKTQVIAIETNSGFDVYSVPELDSLANEFGEVQIRINGNEAIIRTGNGPLWATAHTTNGELLRSHKSLWFSWHANHPDSRLMLLSTRD